MGSDAVGHAEEGSADAEEDTDDDGGDDDGGSNTRAADPNVGTNDADDDAAEEEDGDDTDTWGVENHAVSFPKKIPRVELVASPTTPSLPLRLLCRVAVCFCHWRYCQWSPESHPIGWKAPPMRWPHPLPVDACAANAHANAARTTRTCGTPGCVPRDGGTCGVPPASCDSPGRICARRGQSCPWPCRSQCRTTVPSGDSGGPNPPPWGIRAECSPKCRQ